MPMYLPTVDRQKDFKDQVLYLFCDGVTDLISWRQHPVNLFDYFVYWSDWS